MSKHDSQHAKRLDAQVDALVQHAPTDGLMPQAVRSAAIVLKSVAGQLKHDAYYVLQSADGGWQVATLSNRAAPDIEKHVLYAYSSYAIANLERLKQGDDTATCNRIGIIDLLFRFLAMADVDSLILFDNSFNAREGMEIVRSELQALCEKQLRRLKYGSQRLQQEKLQQAPPHTFFA